jgi:hypothetical protein
LIPDSFVVPIKNVRSATNSCQVFPNILFYQTANPNIIGQGSINRIFLLQKELFFYKVKHYKANLHLELEVVDTVRFAIGFPIG